MDADAGGVSMRETGMGRSSGGHIHRTVHADRGTGGMGFRFTMDFAFDNSGTLWALDSGVNLYTIDPTTGSDLSDFIFGLNARRWG